jgi:type II secretory pathway pseudopilin PulG
MERRTRNGEATVACRGQALNKRAREAGFTFVGLLFAVALAGIVLASVGVVWSTQSRREREAQLLAEGEEIRTAIGRYYTGGGRGFPMTLEDMLDDKRYPATRRYLRRIRPDPMTGVADWELLRDPAGGIMGVASSSHGRPIKQAGFPADEASFENAGCYCDWQFIFVPNAVRRRPHRVIAVH